MRDTKYRNSHFTDSSKLAYIFTMKSIEWTITVPLVIEVVGVTVVALVAEAFVGDVTETLIEEK